MRKTILLTAIVMIAFTSNTLAQSEATDFAATNATVITPISIAKTVDMSFGNLISTVGGGDIVLPTSGVRTGDAAILAGPDGDPTAAAFTVTGETDFTYGITLPGTFNVTDPVSSETMAVGSFVSLPDTSGTLALGTQTLLVGATITMVGGESSGDYTNATDMIVTVFYN